MVMFKYNLKIAWRNLIKDRQFTILNLVGLSAGLACTLLIYLWVQDELSFDKFHEKDGQLYQLMEYRKSPSQVFVSDESSGILGETLAAQMTDIEYAAAVAPPEWFQKFTLSVDDKNIKAVGQYVGKDYFNIFSFKLMQGDKSRVLEDKNSIVLSEDLARKLFGTTENIIGKQVRFEHDKNFFVSGVFERIPYHSSLQFDFVLSFEYYKDNNNWVKTWNNTGPHNFVVLKKGTDIDGFNKRIARVVTTNGGDTTRTVFAMHFSDNYLENTFSHGARLGGKIEYVRLFSLIALFILAIACINFMNLSTAKASRRLKEVGIKKVVGVGRRELILQFLGESILLASLAVVLALVLVWLLLPEFNKLTAKEIALRFDPKLIGSVLVITLVTGLLAGSYPALYLSGFNPISVLKGKVKASAGELWARQGLVVFQFTLSVMLIIAVLVVYKQIQFIQSTNPGYNKDNIIRFQAEGKVLHSEESFVAELKKIPGVVNASYTFHNMIGRNFGGDPLDWEGKDPNAYTYFEGIGAGPDFIETMGMQMAAGRSFSKDFPSDSANIVINEAAARLMGMKSPVGKIVRFNGQNAQIIGVVKDFHFESLHEPVKPLWIALQPGGNPWNKIMVRIGAGNQKETIERIGRFYESYNPGFPFDYNFLDEAYQKQYATEVRVGTLSRYFAGLAILISCLGLFGLAAFTAQRRQKEIGIRKVVGASVYNIVAMLSRDFLKLVLVAILFAFPLSWWGMNQWLHGFAYRVEMGGMVFLLAAAAVVLITLLTISYQALKAALANPVGALHSE
jgi:putative ABC transport system permease protein